MVVLCWARGPAFFPALLRYCPTTLSCLSVHLFPRVHSAVDSSAAVRHSKDGDKEIA